jgi:hypothetical protein
VKFTPGARGEVENGPLAQVWVGDAMAKFIPRGEMLFLKNAFRKHLTRIQNERKPKNLKSGHFFPRAQGCQMVSNQNYQFGFILEGLGIEMLVYFMVIRNS